MKNMLLLALNSTNKFELTFACKNSINASITEGSVTNNKLQQDQVTNNHNPDYGHNQVFISNSPASRRISHVSSSCTIESVHRSTRFKNDRHLSDIDNKNLWSYVAQLHKSEVRLYYHSLNNWIINIEVLLNLRDVHTGSVRFLFAAAILGNFSVWNRCSLVT